MNVEKIISAYDTSLKSIDISQKNKWLNISGCNEECLRETLYKVSKIRENVNWSSDIELLRKIFVWLINLKLWNDSETKETGTIILEKVIKILSVENTGNNPLINKIENWLDNDIIKNNSSDYRRKSPILVEIASELNDYFLNRVEIKDFFIKHNSQGFFDSIADTIPFIAYCLTILQSINRWVNPEIPNIYIFLKKLKNYLVEEKYFIAV